MLSSTVSLHALRADFSRQRNIAMPIAGTIVWTVAGCLGFLLPPAAAALALFLCVGAAFPTGILVGRLIGENVLEKRSELDGLFLHTVVMANLVWGIAIPFFQADPTSVPLTVGILSGMMWVPFSWIIGHWVGLFHGIARTVLIVAAWYGLPDHRFVAIPAVVVAVYLISIYLLATRQPLPTEPA